MRAAFSISISLPQHLHICWIIPYLPCIFIFHDRMYMQSGKHKCSWVQPKQYAIVSIKLSFFKNCHAVWNHIPSILVDTIYCCKIRKCDFTDFTAASDKKVLFYYTTFYRKQQASFFNFSKLFWKITVLKELPSVLIGSFDMTFLLFEKNQDFSFFYIVLFRFFKNRNKMHAPHDKNPPIQK